MTYGYFMNSEDIEILTTQNAELNEKLALALNEIDQLAQRKKDFNHVDGGYYMMSRKAEKYLRELQNANPTASLVFSVLREQMKIGTNAIAISNLALSKILNKSTRTIARAVKYLSDNQYVQIIKTGNMNTYIVNEQIAFSGSFGQRQAVFSATIFAHECEQEEGWDKVKKIKNIPLIYSDGE